MQADISIITVVFKDAAGALLTCESVATQTHQNIEHIIIDGASPDTTAADVQAFIDERDLPYSIRLISEPDNGLYDAMNKGIRMATGRYIWFVNAGDTIHAHDTIEQMLAAETHETDILFGEVMMVDAERKPIGTRSEITTQVLPKQLMWRSLNKGMTVSHQGFLPKVEIAPEYIADNLCADIDWVIKCLKASKQNTNVERVLADFQVGGLSRQRHKQSLKNRYAVLKEHYGFLPNLWNHVIIIMRAAWHRITRPADKRY